MSIALEVSVPPSAPSMEHRPQVQFSLGLLLGFFFLFCAFQNAGYLDVTDAEERFQLLTSLVERQSLQITTWWDTTPRSSIYSIGSVVASLPFYLVGKCLARILGDSVPERMVLVRAVLFGMQFYGAVWLVLVARLLKALRASHLTAFWLTVVIGTGTLIFPYTKTLQTENLTGLFVTAALYAVIRHHQSLRLRYAILGGLSLAAAVTIKTEALLIAPVLALCLAWSDLRRPAFQTGRAAAFRDVLTFTACLLPGLLFVLLYNWVRYGSLLKTGYSMNAFFTPLPTGLFLQLLSPGKGIVWYCPILLLSLYLIPSFARSRPFEAVVLLVPAAAMAVLYSLWGSPAGDAALGSRFMVSYMPCFAAPLLALWSSPVGPRLRVALLTLFAVPSIFLQVVFCGSTFLLHYHGHLLSVPEGERPTIERSLYFDPAFSAISGTADKFLKGLFDLHFVRWLPVEGGLQIYPPFWMLSGSSMLALAFAHGAARALRDGSGSSTLYRIGGRYPVWRPALLPAGALFLLAAAGVGDYREKGLELSYHTGKQRVYKTVARDVAIHDLKHDRVYHALIASSPSSLTWRGYFEAPTEGSYELAVDASGQVELKVDGRELIRSSGPRVATLNLTRGWHKIHLKTWGDPWTGHIRLLWKAPGGQWESIGHTRLKRRRPDEG